MKKNINKILTELYELDPTLKQQEQDLVRVIEKILSKKPNIKLDKAFATKLRQELIGRKTFDFMNILNSRFSYLAGGVAVTLLAVIPTLSILNNAPSSVTEVGGDVAPRITLLGDEAFGPLSGEDGLGAAGVAAIPEALLSARDQSGGGGFAANAELTSLPSPDFIATNFNFIYQGEELDLGQDKLEVLRSKTSSNLVGGLAGRFGLGLVNLQKINNLKFDHISMYDSRENGFSVNVNPSNGEISLSKNLPSSYFIDSEYRPLEPSEVLSDNELFNLANRFIEEYDISLEGYGDPIVSPGYYVQLELARDGSDNSFIPEYVDVVYPLKIRDTLVYDQGANNQGVYVTINVRARQVTSLRGLSIQQYDASAYAIESNIEKLIASKQSQSTYPSGVRVSDVDILLGTPDVVYLTVFNYNNGQEQKLFVPAYLFPVIEKPVDHPYYPDNIIISLVTQFNNDYPRVMMIDDAVSSPPAIELAQPVEELPLTQ